MAAYETERDGQCLAAAGLPSDEARSFLREAPAATTDFSGDRTRFSDYWATSARLRGRLPIKPRRSAREQVAASLLRSARAMRAWGSCAGMAMRSTTH